MAAQESDVLTFRNVDDVPNNLLIVNVQHS